jgi:CRP-like cAMP-binding protein
MPQGSIPGLSGSVAAVLEPLLERVRLRPGKELFAEGDEAHALYLVGSGWVRLFRLAAEGREVTTLVLDPGELFGEEALAEAGRYGHHAEALTPAEVWRLPRALLMEHWAASPEVRSWVLEHLVRRLHAAQGRYRERRYHEVLPRLAALLVRQMQPGREGLEVHLSHEQMAHRLGTGRDTVTRVLGALAMKDLLEINYRRVVVLDPEALRRLARGLEVPGE